MKTIELTKGQVAIIDDEDYYRVSKYKWCVGRTIINSHGQTNYSAKTGWRKTYITLQRFILGIRLKPGYCIDHINGNSLDNRKENLRVATTAENCRNRRKSANTTSQYKGVCRRMINSNLYFVSSIRINGAGKTIGYFKDEVSAARAYDEAAIKNYGEFANTNFENPIPPSKRIIEEALDSTEILKYNDKLLPIMKIRQEVLERMKGRAGDIKPRIMDELGVTHQSVDYWFAQNKENGRLTCKPILKIVGEVLGLTDDEILTEDTKSVKEPEPCTA